MKTQTSKKTKPRINRQDAKAAKAAKAAKKIRINFENHYQVNHILNYIYRELHLVGTSVSR